jgi:hypothetical protein
MNMSVGGLLRELVQCDWRLQPELFWWTCSQGRCMCTCVSQPWQPASVWMHICRKRCILAIVCLLLTWRQPFVHQLQPAHFEVFLELFWNWVVLMCGCRQMRLIEVGSHFWLDHSLMNLEVWSGENERIWQQLNQWGQRPLQNLSCFSLFASFRKS